MENPVKYIKIPILIPLLILLTAFLAITIFASDEPPPPDITIRFAPSPGTFAEGASDIHTGHFGFRIDEFPEPEPPLGYIFVGWFSNGTHVLPSIAAIRNTTLFAAYAPIPDPYDTSSFAIVFDPGPGQLPLGVPPIQSHTYGSPITTFPLPTKEGHCFSGWTWNEEPLTAPHIVRSDMVIEAQWTPTSTQQSELPQAYPIHIPAFQLVVAFNPFPGTFQGNEIGIRLGRITSTIRDMPENPIRSGAVFVGWQLPNGNMLEGPLLIRSDMVLTAIWDTSNEAAAQNPPPSVDNRHNPQTSHLAVSLVLLTAIITLGITSACIIKVKKNQAASANKHRAYITRYAREVRMVIKNEGAKLYAKPPNN